jgi:hypothetical protein
MSDTCIPRRAVNVKRRLPNIDLARALDSRADFELQFGRHVVAEKLANMAAELRQVLA